MTTETNTTKIETITSTDDEAIALALSLEKLRFFVKPQDDGQVSVGFYHDANAGDFRPEAVVNFDRAIALGMDDAVTWGNKAVALRGLKQYDEVLAAADRALELDPESVAAWISKGYRAEWIATV